ncbi:MAG: DedA family protein [Deltaproteobacteria bacterium]|jgi:membrane protein DedA with SNARE-associated domain
MEDLLAALKPYIDQYGYWAVFGAILLEDFGFPMPGESMLIVGALLASQGDLNIVPLLLLAWAAAVAGDNIGFAIGRFGGRRAVLRYGHYVFLTRRRLEHVEGFFARYGGIVVLGARFIEGLRQLNGITAGTVRMVWPRFLLYNVLGAALWVGFWGMLFFEIGGRAGNFQKFFQKFEYVLLGLVCLGLLAVAFRLWRKGRR